MVVAHYVINLQVLAGGRGNDVIDASQSLGTCDIAGGSVVRIRYHGFGKDDVIWGDGYDVNRRTTVTILCSPQIIAAMEYYGSLFR